MYQSEYQTMADAIKARQLLARLADCQQSGARYLNAEMEAAKVKVAFRPDVKAVLQETAHFARTNMADFIREATNAAIVKFLDAKVAAGEALDKAALAKEAA